jgi:predicted secreted hydrolase
VHVLWPEWPAYWDGPIEVSGDATGRGWLDLTHYCLA